MVTKKLKIWHCKLHVEFRLFGFICEVFAETSFVPFDVGCWQIAWPFALSYHEAFVAFPCTEKGGVDVIH